MINIFSAVAMIVLNERLSQNQRKKTAPMFSIRIVLSTNANAENEIKTANTSNKNITTLNLTAMITQL